MHTHTHTYSGHSENRLVCFHVSPKDTLQKQELTFPVCYKKREQEKKKHNKWWNWHHASALKNKHKKDVKGLIQEELREAEQKEESLFELTFLTLRHKCHLHVDRRWVLEIFLDILYKSVTQKTLWFLAATT